MYEKQRLAAETLHSYCTALCQTKNPITGHFFTKKEIAYALFEGKKNAAIFLSKALSTTDGNLNQQLFLGCTRETLIGRIKTHYADFLPKETIKETSSESIYPYFEFKQYYMTRINEAQIVAACLKLFYVKHKNGLHFTDFELHVPAISLPTTVLKGKVLIYGTNTLILQATEPDYFMSTIIHIDHRFLLFGATDSMYYMGDYLTRTYYGDIYSGLIVLDYVKSENDWKNTEVPLQVASFLKDSKQKIKAPMLKSEFIF